MGGYATNFDNIQSLPSQDNQQNQIYPLGMVVTESWSTEYVFTLSLLTI